MAVVRYRNYYISVLLTPDKSGNSSCIPFAEIRHKGDHSPVARLMFSEAFDDANDATSHGLVMGKKWVDEKEAANKSKQSSESGTEVAGKLQPEPFGFKS